MQAPVGQICLTREWEANSPLVHSSYRYLSILLRSLSPSSLKASFGSVCVTLSFSPVSPAAEITSVRSGASRPYKPKRKEGRGKTDGLEPEGGGRGETKTFFDAKKRKGARVNGSLCENQVLRTEKEETASPSRPPRPSAPLTSHSTPTLLVVVVSLSSKETFSLPLLMWSEPLFLLRFFPCYLCSLGEGDFPWERREGKQKPFSFSPLSRVL